MFFYKIIHWVIYFLFKDQVAEVKGLENLPKNDGFIIAANHETAYDPLIIVTVLRSFLRRYFSPRLKKIYFLGKAGMRYKIFRYNIATVLVNLLGEKMGYLPANRAGLIRAIELLEQGHIIVIFPESHQNIKKQLLRGRRGVSVLALRSMKEVVPTGCFGNSARNLKQFLKYWKEKKRIIFGPRFCLTPSENKATALYPAALNAATNIIMQAISKVSNKNYPFSH
ncbi:MAG: lysophospholipid acyltransferase family protein [bacterium]|nr:lysophospholipid acyltransferase family protein [bacterium]